MSTSAATQAFSCFENSLTALAIGSWGRLSQITCRTSFSSAIVFGFGWRLWSCDRPPTLPPRHGNPRVQVGWIWRPLFFGNEIWAVGLEPVLRGTSYVCWHAVLLEDVSTGQSKFIYKELAVLLFTNTTSQMTSLTASWLLVILNHWKNSERFSCIGFRTKFLIALKSLGANTVMLITVKYCKLMICWYDC